MLEDRALLLVQPLLCWIITVAPQPPMTLPRLDPPTAQARRWYTTPEEHT